MGSRTKWRSRSKYEVDQGGHICAAGTYYDMLVSAAPSICVNLSKMSEYAPIHVIEWLDANNNGSLDAGEQRRTVIVDGVRGGKDITAQLKMGTVRLDTKFLALSSVKKMAICYNLIVPPYAMMTAWDIVSLIGDNMVIEGICGRYAGGVGINSRAPYHVVTVVNGAGKAEVYPTTCANYFLFGCIMRLCYDFRATCLLDNSKWNLVSTKALVTGWRTIKNAIDGDGVAAAVAFAEAGWTGNWNAINGLGIPGAVPSPTAFSGQLRWRVASWGMTEQVGMIDFQQGSTWSNYWDN